MALYQCTYYYRLTDCEVCSEAAATKAGVGHKLEIEDVAGTDEARRHFIAAVRQPVLDSIRHLTNNSIQFITFNLPVP